MAAPNTRISRIPKLGTHKASGRAVVRLNGRDVYRGKAGTPEARAEYDRVIAEWLERGRAGLGPEVDFITPSNACVQLYRRPQSSVSAFRLQPAP